MTAAVRGTRGIVALAVLVGLVVGIGTWLAAVAEPARYEARVDLLASPLPNPDPAVVQLFSTVASNSLPAIIDVAQSPAVLARASTAVPGAPEPGELASSIVVDIVPQSLLTRISVQASSPDTAARLAAFLADAIVGRDLIATVGRLRVVDPEPVVSTVAPDRVFAAGLAGTAAVASTAAAFVLCVLIRPSPRRRLTELLSAAGVNERIAVIDRRAAGSVADVAVLAAAAARPVRVVALHPAAEPHVRQYSDALTKAGVSVADGAPHGEQSVVGLVSGRVSQTVAWTAAALPADHRLIAISYG